MAKLQLRLHRLVCSVCRGYAHQVKKLRQFFRGNDWQEQLPPLSESARQKIQREVQRELSGR